MSLLARLAKVASQYLRGRQSQRPRPPGPYMRSRPGAPPVQTGASAGRALPPVPPPAVDDEDDYDDVALLGRDAGYDENEMAGVLSRMREVSSSNVWAYGYEPETQRMGILYVTFLLYVPKRAGGDGEKQNAPGPTYAYYDFPLAKFKRFESMAASSAGGAVWEYCRVRHSKFEHQHTYRLAQVNGEYVPRKVTALGYKDRAVPRIGVGRRSFQRSTLPAERMDFRNGAPNRGEPNRGRPNRGR